MQYKNEIDCIAKQVRDWANPETVRELLVKENITEFYYSQYVSGQLAINLLDGHKIIYVGIRYSPQERLLTFFHEIFHIPFNILSKSFWKLEWEDYRYLEDSLDKLASEFVSKYYGWSVKFFLQCFGYAHNTNIIAPRLMA